MSELLNRIDLRYDFVKGILRNHLISDSGCWLYQGQISQRGYAKCKIYSATLTPKKRNFLVHRVSYAFYNGADPESMMVCHHCDTPSCVNPDHLFLGTSTDNMRDMINKGRSAPQHGELNPRALLNEEGVLDVIAKIREGLNNKEIAETLPVSHSQVSLIRLGKTWQHVLKAANYDPEEYRQFTRRAS